MGLLEQNVGGYGGGVKTCSCENAITKDLTQYCNTVYRNRRICDFLKELDLTEGRLIGVPKMLKAMATKWRFIATV